MGLVAASKEAGGEGGFTLTELLVAITTLGIISGALCDGVRREGGHSSAETTQRFKESHDAQIVSAYLATDVQSANKITASTCGSPGGLGRDPPTSATTVRARSQATSTARMAQRSSRAGASVTRAARSSPTWRSCTSAARARPPLVTEEPAIPGRRRSRTR